MSTLQLDIEPLTGTLGAVVHGIDLTRDLTAEQAAAVRSAAVAHRVIFLRDQHLTPGQQVAFSRHFGTLTPAHPLVGGLDDQHPEVLQLDSADYPLGVGSRGKGTSYNNRWHTDVTFSATPPAFAVLAGKVIPARKSAFKTAAKTAAVKAAPAKKTAARKKAA